VKVIETRWANVEKKVDKNFVERGLRFLEQTGTGLLSWLGIIEIYTASRHRQTITKRAFRVYWCNVVIRKMSH
jgi:hypothetical protein